MSFLSLETPSSVTALSYTSAVTFPFLTREDSAARVILCESISKNFLRFGLVSDLPNPSVPRTVYSPPTHCQIISGTAI